MERERLIGSTRRGLQQTKEFVKANPAMLLAIFGASGALSASTLGLSIVHENAQGIIRDSIDSGINIGAIIGILKIKASKVEPTVQSQK